jgi:uncharacterized cupredoxin-like copper-binding protein
MKGSRPFRGAVIVAVVAFGSVGCSGGSTPRSTPSGSTGTHVQVSLSEFKIKPTATTARSGPVTFSVTNDGKAKHEFVVLRTDKAAGSLPVKGGRASEAGNIGETGDLAPGESKTVSLDLKPGHYDFICNLPGHYKAGMHRGFRVR